MRHQGQRSGPDDRQKDKPRSATQRGAEEVRYDVQDKPVEEVPEFTFPGQLPVPAVKAFCSRFDIALERTDTYEGRQVLHFRGAASEDETEGGDPQEARGGQHSQLMAEMELVVDLETGLPLVFIVYGKKDGELYPVIRQRLSRLKFDAGLEESDFKYEEERVTEKALTEAAKGVETAEAVEAPAD